jgi:hypothetical protein
VSLVIDREGDRGGALFPVRARCLRVAFEVFDMSGKLALPADDRRRRRSCRHRSSRLYFFSGRLVRLRRLRRRQRHFCFGFSQSFETRTKRSLIAISRLTASFFWWKVAYCC